MTDPWSVPTLRSRGLTLAAAAAALAGCALATPPEDGALVDAALPAGTEIPAASHPYGIRPGGEGGTTPALALVIGAITDALKDYGVRHIEMPATPERVWRAIRAAQAAAATV